MKLYITSIAIVFIVAAGTVQNIKAECEDYSPCNCGQNAEGNLFINCIDVLPTDIQAAFSRTTALDIYSLVLILPASGGDIPADLLSDKRALLIDLIGPSKDSFQLTMDPGALRSSSSYTTQLVISKCNLIQLDFSFLKGFSRLEELRFDYISNIKPIEDLPPLVNLVGLTIDNSQGFEALTNFPAVAFSRLNHLYLFNDELSDLATEIILDAFVSSASATTLQVLTLSKNQITRVPQQITALSNLRDFALTNNNVSFITTGAFSLTAPNKVYLNNISLDAIEAAAFQGDYTYAEIDLTNNNLVSFDSSVFQPILTQMAGVVDSTGTVNLANNPFSCDCGLAWLIRDNPNLIKATNGGTCANSTSFENLNPGGYVDCGTF